MNPSQQQYYDKLVLDLPNFKKNYWHPIPIENWKQAAIWKFFKDYNIEVSEMNGYFIVREYKNPDPWNVSEIEKELEGIELIDNVELRPGEVVKDAKKFVQSCLCVVKSKNGIERYKCYLEDLKIYLNKIK